MKNTQYNTPEAQYQSRERRIPVILIKEVDLRLSEIAKESVHPAHEVALRLVNAARHSPGLECVESSVFKDLINLALTLHDEKFLALVRDVVTNCVTSFETFDLMLKAKYYTPAFDCRFGEQKFLAVEYRRQKCKLRY